MSEPDANWILVCKEDELGTDDLRRFDYDNRTFCIYHIEDGYYATDGLCTHESVHLADGYLTDNEIECPQHFAAFDIKSGKVLCPPACFDLKTYPVRLADGNVYIGL